MLSGCSAQKAYSTAYLIYAEENRPAKHQILPVFYYYPLVLQDCQLTAILLDESLIKRHSLTTVHAHGPFVMTKSELIARLAAQNPSLYHRDIERLVNTVFETITEALISGDRVELRGFGAFSLRERGSRIGRNPRTGESVNVSAKRMPFFKMGKGMRERLNKD